MLNCNHLSRTYIRNLVLMNAIKHSNTLRPTPFELKLCDGACGNCEMLSDHMMSYEDDNIHVATRCDLVKNALKFYGKFKIM